MCLLFLLIRSVISTHVSCFTINGSDVLMMLTCWAHVYLLSGGLSEQPDELGVLLELAGVVGAAPPVLGTQ